VKTELWWRPHAGRIDCACQTRRYSGGASGLLVIPPAAHFSNVEQPGIFNQAMPGFRDPVTRRQLLRSARNGLGREWDIACCIVFTREMNNDIRS